MLHDASRKIDSISLHYYTKFRAVREESKGKKRMAGAVKLAAMEVVQKFRI